MDLIALLLILAFVLWLQMRILCGFAFKKLEYRCEFSVPEAHEGDTITLVETVYNGKLLPVPWLRVDIHTSRWLEFAGTCCYSPGKQACDQQLRTQELSEDHPQMEAQMPEKRGFPYRKCNAGER